MMLSILLCFAGLINATSSYIASFYGDSFVFESLNSSPSDTTTVSLRFMASSSDGILFLALGYSQSLLIELVNSRLEVKIDLGFGEEVLSTAEDESLNNLIWHEFKVIRSGSNIKIVLNRNDVAASQIPVPDSNGAKFSLDFGVFLGGIGGNVTLLDGTRPNKLFRGCILEAEIDSHDLLSSLRSIEDQKIVNNVVGGCPRLFQMSQSEPITFDSSSAYVALRRWTTHDEGTFECMVKTNGSSAIILYNAGRGSEEFIALEMIDGFISASVNKGGGVVSLHTTTSINDGIWHTVRFHFSPSFFDIRIDGRRTNAFIDQSSPDFGRESGVGVPRQNLDLTGRLYIGGVPDSLAHRSGITHGLISLGSSNGKATKGGAFPGCMKNIRINHRRKGFSDFLVSSEVSVGCKTSQILQNSDKPLKTSQAIDAISKLFAQYSMAKLRPQTTTIQVVTSDTTTSTTTVPKFVIPELDIIVRTLRVREGASAIITDQEISYSSSEMEGNDGGKEILFVSSAALMNGYLTKSNSCVGTAAVSEFSLKDITMKTVRYCHDGSETLVDAFNFTLVWNLSDRNAAERKEIISLFSENFNFLSTGIVLDHGHAYTLPISVTAVNDVPELFIPPDYLFHPVKNVPTHLPASVLNATDVDNIPEEIIYFVLENGAEGEFHIASEDEPGQPMKEFTQADVNSNKVVLLHNGQRDNARLFLRVSNPDAVESSGQPHTNVLRITAVALNMSVSIEKITLLERTAFILTKHHLSVSTNAESSITMVCNIKKKPSLGLIEMLSEEEWTEVSNFTIEQVNNGDVRYRNIKRTSTHRDSDEDRFDFTVSGANVESEVHSFLFEITRVDVEFFVRVVLLDQGSQETLLTVNDFHINVTHLFVKDGQMQVKLLKSPRFIEIFYNDKGLVLDSADSFTVEESKTGRVSLKVKQKHASKSFQEMIPLSLVVNDLYESATVRLNVTYLPDLDRILLVKKSLSVDEGQELKINSNLLRAYLPPSPINDKITLFHFNVTKAPIHGILKLVEEEESTDEMETPLDLGSTDEFLSSDLDLGKLRYCHDDSETSLDYFSVNVTPVLEGQLPQAISKLSTVHFESDITIKIRLVNDERPERIVERPFEIVRRSERLLTKEDLWYHDADIDYDDMDLMISSRGLTNGDILNATSRRHEKISRFKQRQVVNGEVLIKHKGRDSGRFIFWVTDGKHYTTGLITISASDPFLNVVNSSVLSVTTGKEIAVTTTELCFKTNTKGLQRDIIYKVTKGPVNGLLYLNTTSSMGDNGNPSVVSRFTQQDIIDEILVYEHSGSLVMDDIISFRVTTGMLFSDGNLTVRVLLESHRKPPVIQKNHTLVVQQGQRVQIRKQDLRVVHPDTRATDIRFSLTSHPTMGSLEFVTNVETPDFNSELVTEFTQADINKGLVWYAQNGSFRYSDEDFVNGLLIDHMEFNVTNNIMSVSNQKFLFDIVPDEIPLRLTNFSVGEGRTKAVVEEYLHIEGTHYDDDDVQIRVVLQPSHGTLESQAGVAQKSFSYKLVTAEFLYYSHDGSDYLRDNFTLQAFTLDGKKESGAVTAFVNVLPENDEKPVLVNNTGLNVWINSATAITPSSLAYADPDSEPDEVNFQILPPSNGWVAVKGNPYVAILNFTQAQINKGEIVFKHKGPTTGGFTFQADDGTNCATKGIFVITARPLIISVKTTGEIKSFPGFDVPLQPSALQSKTNDLDDLDRLVTYVITTQPKHGKLVKIHKDGLNSSSAMKLLNFTDADIDTGLIFFRQDVKLEKWSQIDSFVVTASSPPAEDITDIKIAVNITYDAADAVGKQSPVQVNKGYTIAEGGRFVINSSVLDAGNLFKKLPAHRDRKQYELIYIIAKLPLHGNLSVAEKNVTEVNTTFTQTQLMSGRIAYTHDHSDTFEDHFNFCVYLTDPRFSTSNGKPWVVPHSLFRDTFSIKILPLNDNPPKLLTKGKILKVVDGFESVISPDTLKAIDADNDARDILFSIIRPPSCGKITLVSDTTVAITKFSQEDVNHKKVVFIPYQTNMTEPKLEDAFYYGFTDGIQRSSYNFLKIEIVPVFVRFSPEVIEVTQAHHSTFLSSSLMNLSTNGNYSLITFAVNRPAESGTILVREQESEYFSYDDLVKMNVEFAMTDSRFSKDSLQLQLIYNRTAGAKISKLATVEIVVMPMIMRGSIQASCRGLTRIGLTELNASALFEMTGSMPVYKVLKKPALVKILKLSLPEGTERRRREIDSQLQLLSEVNSFTHEDVSLGYMFLHGENNNVTDGVSLPDSIELSLHVADGSVQPAEFTVDFSVIGAEPEDFGSFFKQFVTTVDEETTTSVQVLVTDEEQPLTAVSMTMNLSKSASPIKKVNDIYDKERRPTALNAINPEVTKPLDSELSEAGVSWMIPVLVVAALIIVLLVALTCVFLYKKCHRKEKKYLNNKEECSEENCSLTMRENMGGRNQCDLPAERQQNPLSREALRSPACPGVTVTLLRNGPRSDSIYDSGDRNSMLGSAAGHSYQDDPSTAYAPSTMYHYDDVGSCDYTNGPEVEFYAVNQGNYREERLYHARSAKLIDPDVLALYSSDESIPSMIDEKYAIPISSGSVPSGLHRTTKQSANSRTSITARHSTSSLSKFSQTPELSLLPDSGLQSNQYWI